MKALIIAATLAFATLAGADALHDPKFNEALPANHPPGGFVPVVLFYIAGHFVELKQIADPEPTIVKCMEKASSVVNGLMQSEQRPANATALGGCLPVPAAPVSKAAADRPYHDNKPSILGGINSEKI